MPEGEKFGVASSKRWAEYTPLVGIVLTDMSLIGVASGTPGRLAPPLPASLLKAL